MAHDLLWQEIWSETPLLGVLKKNPFANSWKYESATAEPVSMLKSRKLSLWGWKCLCTLSGIPAHINLSENVHILNMLHCSVGNYLNAHNTEWRQSTKVQTQYIWIINLVMYIILGLTVTLKI